VAAWVLVELPGRVRLPRWGADVIAGVLGAAAFAAAIAVA
jgi:hypothetical protein